MLEKLPWVKIEMLCQNVVIVLITDLTQHPSDVHTGEKFERLVESCLPKWAAQRKELVSW